MKENRPPFAPVAWEMLRRSPEAKCLLEQNVTPNSLAAWLLQDHGLVSWRSLIMTAKREWRKALSTLPPLHGRDPRPVVSITHQSVHLEHVELRNAVLALDKKLRDLASRDADAQHILKSAEVAREAEIARLAIEHHRAGRVLIAVHPDSANINEVIDAVRACYVSHRRPTRQGHWEAGAWLAVVEQFEVHEIRRPSSQRRNDQLFARYRRTMDKWAKVLTVVDL